MANTTPEGWLLIALFIAATFGMARLLGPWLFALYEGRAPRALAWLAPAERLITGAAGRATREEQGWKAYAVHLLVFNAAGILLLLLIQLLQAGFLLNPQEFGAVPFGIALNTAVSFVTNTNWQSYAGETTMSNGTQMLGLTVQNFLSAATGIAVAFAIIRGFARRETKTLGNFWADLVRITLYLLVPLCVAYALALVLLGVPQTFAGSAVATTLEGARQTIALGPVASQEAIKMLGTNGGGFFNANSAHPLENPNALTNLLQMLSIFAIGAGLTWCFGKAVGNTRQGWAVLAAMMLLFAALTSATYIAEASGNPIHQAAGVVASAGNMEGKEVRFGIAASALFASVTTSASCGAVNAMHDSFTALGGMIPLFNMHLGEVIVGGVGAGLYGMLLYVILGIFIAGLMVGRTPEYVGKKIEAREVKLAVIAIAILPLFILGLTASALVLPEGLAGLQESGPHGLTEALYAYTSAVANNGSAFGGLTATNDWWAYTLALAMAVGRFAVIVPVLAIAGSLAAKRVTSEGAGSFPTTGPLWVGLLAGLIIILGGLTFLPSLALGPIADHLAMISGQTF
ncbi:potassium-transporting ATPase subunit KdpA [Sphingomonas rosea]|uniref:Potassium-transporting ATPase potassium-binding subunit n=1 Tax=Sphingomonas rosea TaxID=335605 RepID=A0ABP7U7Y1_9SPHN